MKLKMNRTHINRFFEYSWFYLIVIAILSYVAFYYPIHKINEYKNYEKIVFFSAGGFFLEKDFNDNILNAFPEDILAVEVYDYSPNEPYLGSMYETYGMKADFLILSEETLQEAQEGLEKTFRPLLEVIELETKYDYFIKNDQVYGLKIYDNENQEYNEKYRFNSWINFINSSNYYLLINKKSVNFVKEAEKKTSNHGIQVFYYLLERYGSK